MRAVLAVLVVLVVAAVGVAYGRFRASPAGVWRRRVLAHVRGLEARREALRRAGADTEAAVARLANEAFRRYTQTVAVDRLAEYPNIGPATVGKVRDAGCRSLLDLERLNFGALPDIGAARAASLRDATASLLTEARSRFHAGGCPEAQEFTRQAAALRAADAGQAADRARELAGIDRAINDTFDLHRLAEAVRFPFALFGPVPGLTPDVMARPLPEPKPLEVVRPLPNPSPAGGGAANSPSPLRGGGGGVGSSPPPPADLFRDALNGTAAPPAPERPGVARLRAVVKLGFAVAKVDGRVTQAERKVIRAYLDEAFGHDPAAARHIDPQMEQAGKANPDDAAAVAAVRAAVPAADWPGLVRWAERIADASGDRHPKEVEVLERVAKGLGVTAETPPPNPLPGAGRGDQTPALPPLLAAGRGLGGGVILAPDPRTVLDIPADAVLDAGLVRRKYHQLADKLDPAKAAALGPEFARLAEEKRAAARAAAEALLAPLGEPLEKPEALPPPADLRHNPDLDDVFG